MDIKDFILIIGGLLIAAVVVHGFWIAWRARRDPLRLDLVAHLPETDEGDDLQRLRAELPNGGGRVVGEPRAGKPRQSEMDLTREAGRAETPTTATEAPRQSGRRTEPRLEADPASGAAADATPDEAEPPAAKTSTQRPIRATADRPAAAASAAASRKETAASRKETAASRKETAANRKDTAADGEAPAAADPTPAADAPRPSRRDRVKDVILPDRSGRAEEPREPRRFTGRKAAQEEARDERPAARHTRGGVRPAEEPARNEDVEELIVLNVLAPRNQPFVGGGVVEALRARGLRYGRMNIFHRVDPMTRSTLYSVANVVEPGTFDIADLDNFRSPGVCFFLQLPGPEQPLEVFEDMLKVARDVAVRVGGSLVDEQRSVMTGQTVEHYRARIAEFCRRRMSMRA